MRLRTILTLGGIVALVAVAALVVNWWLSRDTPAAVSISEAVGESDTQAPRNDPVLLEGSWRVSTTAESFAGVRIDEELRGIGAVTAVLRTSDVAGDAQIIDGVLTALDVTVDLTTLSSDDPRRDRMLANALDFANFPTASFHLNEPVNVADLNERQLTFPVTGTLRINGVSQPATVMVTAEATVGALIAVAQLPVTFRDFGVQLPSAPIVLSLSDDGIVEVQLRFVPR